MPNGYATVEIDGMDITSEIGRGKMSGWIDVRDTQIPGYKTRLDNIAFSVAQQVNGLHKTGTDLLGGTGNNFFAPIASAAGAAAAIGLDAGVAGDSRLVSVSGTGATGDNQIAKAITDLRDARVVGGTNTFSESWGQLVYQVGSDSQTAQVQQKTRQEVVDQVTKLRDQVSGVSLDEESAQMMKFQRAYEANARYFSTVDSMLNTLMTAMSTS
jgi:flagellar hook-associated protein 1 FlgK